MALLEGLGFAVDLPLESVYAGQDYMESFNLICTS